MLLCSMSYVFNKSKYEQKNLPSPDKDLQRCSYKQACWKYATNLQENTHAEVSF